MAIPDHQQCEVLSFCQDPAVEQAFDQRNSLGTDGLVMELVALVYGKKL